MIPPFLIAALIASTTSGTINHNPITERSTTLMAQGGNPGSPNIQFPVRHPNQPLQTTRFAAPGPGHRGAATGYPTNNGRNRMASESMPTPVEHTNRPR